jgi:hypothetical protein
MKNVTVIMTEEQAQLAADACNFYAGVQHLNLELAKKIVDVANAFETLLPPNEEPPLIEPEFDENGHPVWPS